MAQTSANGQDELWLSTLIGRPVRAVDSTLRTGVALVTAGEALRAVPRLAGSLERLVPAVERAVGSLDRIDRLSTFVGQELPETQHQLDQLRAQLGAAVAGVTELGPQLAANTAVNRALTESITVLGKTLGVARGTHRAVGGILDLVPDVLLPEAHRRTDTTPP